MNIAKKTIIITLVILLLNVLLFVSSYAILTNRLLKIETQMHYQSVSRVLDVIDFFIYAFSNLSKNLATAEDLIQFVNSEEPNFQNNYFDASFLTNAGCNMILLYDAQGKLIHGANFDLELRVMQIIPSQLENIPTQQLQAILSGQMQGGIILLPQGPFMFGVHVVKRNGGEEPHGILFVGRYLDSLEAHNIASLTNYSFEIIPSWQVPVNAEEIIELNDPAQRKVLLAKVNSDEFSGYGMIKDMYGEVVCAVRMEIHRDYYQQVKVILNYLVILSSVGLLVFEWIGFVLMNKFLLDRISKQTSVVKTIAVSGNLQSEIEEIGSDEIAFLGKAINGMLRTIRKQTDDLKAIQSELIVAKEIAEESCRAKDVFVAKVSHEIRTPMNGIIGMIELLKQSGLTGQQNYYNDLLDCSARSLMSLLNNILDFSRIESGKMQLEEIEFDLWLTLENAVRVFSIEAAQKDLEVLLDIDFDLPVMVKGDSLRVNQILTNLLNNALKFTEKGEFNICAKVNQWYDEKALIYVSIKDTGIGISREKLATLFQAFSQADNSIARRYGGTGLGLAISKGIIEEMGGEISCSSEIGHGSEFSFVIPLKVCKSPCQKDKTMERKRILVVDDNSSVLSIVRRLLEHYGAEVDICRQPLEAFFDIQYRLDEGEPYDMIFMESSLIPPSDGAFIREIKKLFEANPKCAVIIMVTAKSVTEQERWRSIFPFATLVIKPITLRALDAFFNSNGREKVNVLTLPAEIAGKKTVVMKRKLKILIVEDIEINRVLAGEFLKNKCITLIARDGVEALEILHDNEFDLILMDLQMPRMDGFEATRQIRQLDNPHKARVPIIAMTANSDEKSIKCCRDSGMDDYILKPIDSYILYEKILTYGGEALEQDKPLDENNRYELVQENIQELCEIVNSDTAFVLRLIQSFIDLSPEILVKAKEQIETDNRWGFCESMHSLKGTMLNLRIRDGIELVEELMENVELSSKTMLLGRLRDLEQIMAQYQKNFATITEQSSKENV